MICTILGQNYNLKCLPVKEAGRDFTYLIVVLIGLGVTGEYKTPRDTYHSRFIASHLNQSSCLVTLYAS